MWENDVIDKADSYNYLGILFMMMVLTLITKCRQLTLPIDVQLELFDTLVVPTIFYGC